MGDRLAKTDGPKSGREAAVPLSIGGGAGSPSNTSPGPRPTSIQSGILIHPAVWSQQTWAEKWGEAAAPLSMGGAGSPSNTMSPGPRTTSIPSGNLIHPTVWLQYTNTTHRQDRQTGQWSCSIRQTVTCNGCPKTKGNW